MIINIFYKNALIFLFVLFIQIPVHANCSKSYTLGFFNGVWNTNYEANIGREKLKKLIGITYNSGLVKYETFYNHTGKSVGATALQDLAETFIQRSAEIDASGELGKRFEYFWEFIGSSKPTFIDKIKGIAPKLNALFDSLYTTIVTNLVGAISYMNSSPPTEADYASHNAKLDALAANGEKLMLVAHSQGNLFVNHAYDHILPVVTKNRVAVAHIAPASPTLRGDYLLADIDIVINAMRLQGINSVPDTNLPLPFSKADTSGHTLIGTYLDETREGRGKVKTMIEAGMGKLNHPPCPITLEYYWVFTNLVFSYRQLDLTYYVASPLEYACFIAFGTKTTRDLSYAFPSQYVVEPTSGNYTNYLSMSIGEVRLESDSGSSNVRLTHGTGLRDGNTYVDDYFLARAYYYVKRIS